MWWERFGVAPVRPQDVDGRWHAIDLTLKSMRHLERAVKAAGAAGAVAWWMSPWETTAGGHQATVTVYFAKRTQARTFGERPPVSQRR